MPSFSAIIAALLVARVITGIQGRLPQLIRAAVLTIAIPVAAPPIVLTLVSIAVAISISIIPIISIVTVVVRILGIVSALKR